MTGVQTADVVVIGAGAFGATTAYHGYPILGPVPGLAGFHVASGCCVGGLTLSPAAGRALADLILDGRSDPDLAPLSIERYRGRFTGAAELEAACVARHPRKYLK